MSQEDAEEAMFARWKALAGDAEDDPWDEDRLGMFFQHFRPDGKGVEAAFVDVVGGDEILPRLREVYRVTAEGWADGDSQDGYFIVRQPAPLAATAARTLAEDHLRQMAALAHEALAAGKADAAELCEILASATVGEVVPGERPWPPDDDAPESLLYEVIGDYLISLRYGGAVVDSHAHLLEEAFYTIACDPYLKSHLLWPVYRPASAVEEPFASYFELWKHGAGYRFEGDRVRVYVPHLVA